MSTRTSIYDYLTLPSDEHIRLLHLRLIGPERNLLEVRLDVFPLHSAPEYYALSYRWGPEIQTSWLPGAKLTEALMHCIPRIGNLRPGHLWIDAICINQADTKEKNKQVKLMGTIDARAKGVIAFLGNDQDSSRAAMLLALQIYNGFVDGDLDYNFEISVENPLEDQLRKGGLPGIDDPSWYALLKLFLRPYFQRMWMIQELALAAGAVSVLCGGVMLNWKVLQHVAVWLRQSDIGNRIRCKIPADGSRDIAADLPLVVSKLGANHNRDLYSLIRLTRRLIASDPRDKIIFLLGLLDENDPLRAKIEPRYDQSTASFYIHVTAALINTHRDLKILEIVDMALTQVQGLPSWVSDYSIPHFVLFLAPTIQRDNGLPFRANVASHSMELTLEIKEVDEVMIVAEDASKPRDLFCIEWLKAMTSFAGIPLRYWFLGAAGPIYQHPVWADYAFMSTSMNVKELVRSSAEECPSTEELNNIGRHFENFWKTLLKDAVDTQYPAPDIYGAHYYAWFCREIMTYLDISELDDGVFFPYASILKLAENECTLHPHKGDADLFNRALGRSLGLRRFFITKSGHFGLGPLATAPGDSIAMTGISNELLVLRKAGSVYRLAGTSYVHGLMSGQHSRTERSCLRRVVIV